MYSYEPGKTNPLPPIPTTNTDIEKDSKDESDPKDKYEELDNPNEFKSSPSRESVEEKKLLSDVIDVEEEKKIETDIKLKGLIPHNTRPTFMSLPILYIVFNLSVSDRREY